MRLLWIGLIAAAADDQGRILYNTSLIRAKVFMYDDTSNEEVENWLAELAKDNKIVIYVAGGKQLIQITKWWEYQTPGWASHSKYPPPDGWIDRVRCHVSGHNQGGKVETLNWDKNGGFANGDSELHSKQDSELHSKQDSGIVNVNYDVNYDVDGESTQQKTGDDLFDACQAIYETKKGRLITDGQAFSQMIANFKVHGVTADDYAAAIDAMDADDRYKGNKPTSYERWAIGYAEKRKNPVYISHAAGDGEPERKIIWTHEEANT